MSRASKKDAAKREILRRPHKDDFHEQREHDQEHAGLLRLRSVSSSTGATGVRRVGSNPVGAAPEPEVSRKIAVLTDLSLSSRRAVDLAVELCVRSSAELVVVRCVEPVVPMAAAARKALETEVKRIREVLPTARKKLLQGCDAERITAFVEEAGVVLWVLGAASTSRRRCLDGVAEKVARSSPAPVLVVGAHTEWLGFVAALDDIRAQGGYRRHAR